ncbi:MAG: type II secretion system F family protein [Candidatus Rokuibacteriota bacterium]
MNGLAALMGIWVVGGLLFAFSGLRRVPVKPKATRTRKRVEWPTPERSAMIVGGTLAVLLLTRWPVAGAAAGLAVCFFTSPALRERNESGDLADALTTWAEMLRDATGTPRGIEGVLVATAGGAPTLIRPYVVKLARRLPYETLDVALDGLAEDLDHPIGDLVVTALRLSAHSGGRQIRAVLDDLAEVAREEAQMHRRVEVARARPRADMRSVLFVMGFFILLFMVVARDYLSPYGTVVGQVVLVLVIAMWAAGVAAMAAMGKPRPVERFLKTEVQAS